jgi:hypothetical protein
MGIVPPTSVPSVLLPGSEGVDPLSFLPLSTPAPRAPLPFIIMRARRRGAARAGGDAAAAPAGRQADGRGAEADVRATGVEVPCVEVVSPRRLGMGDIVASLRCRAQLDDGVELSLVPELASHSHRAACGPD